jgi:uncharacterized membrane protein YphA (DoxX/SURF4 family)
MEGKYPEWDSMGRYPERLIHIWIIRILMGTSFLLSGLLIWTCR